MESFYTLIFSKYYNSSISVLLVCIFRITYYAFKIGIIYKIFYIIRNDVCYKCKNHHEKIVRSIQQGLNCTTHEEADRK